ATLAPTWRMPMPGRARSSRACSTLRSANRTAGRSWTTSPTPRAAASTMHVVRSTVPRWTCMRSPGSASRASRCASECSSSLPTVAPKPGSTPYAHGAGDAGGCIIGDHAGAPFMEAVLSERKREPGRPDVDVAALDPSHEGGAPSLGRTPRSRGATEVRAWLLTPDALTQLALDEAASRIRAAPVPGELVLVDMLRPGERE